MGITTKEAICPFPGLCEFWTGEGCSIRATEKPLILCSMAELKKEKIEFTKKDWGEYLDRHIRIWESKRRYTRSEFAKFYVDTYQKVRKDLLGEELKLPERGIKVTMNEKEDL